MNFGTLGTGFGGMGRGGAVASFNPATLYAGGYTGFFFDPSDLTSLAQASGGTGAVTADADPVGFMRDLSGNAFHVSQSTDAKRPLYKTSGGLSWIKFDGSDDDLRNAAAQIGLTDMTVMLAVMEDVEVNNAGFLSIFPAAGSDQSRVDGIEFESSSVTEKFRVQASTPSSLLMASSGAGATPLAIYEFTKTAAAASLFINGVAAGTNNSFTALSATSSGGFMLGGRFQSGSISASFKLNGRFYGGFCINRVLTSGELLFHRTRLAAKAGVSL